MKSLEQIKNEYALDKKFKSWENFCFMANDSMFARAVDDIARLYAEYRTRFFLSAQNAKRMYRRLSAGNMAGENNTI